MKGVRYVYTGTAAQNAQGDQNRPLAGQNDSIQNILPGTRTRQHITGEIQPCAPCGHRVSVSFLQL